jgi:hypothetical protein
MFNLVGDFSADQQTLISAFRSCQFRWGPRGIRSGVCGLLLLFPLQAYAQVSGSDVTWVKLSAMSADYIEKAPPIVRSALADEISADKARWATKIALDRNGRKLPGAHKYIAPNIAWAEAELPDVLVSLSLSDSQCDAPNSGDAPDLTICNAIVSVKRGDEYRMKKVSICYAGAGDSGSNEIAYDKQKDSLLYRVSIPKVDTDYCSKEFMLK